MFWFKIIKSIVSFLHSDISPKQVSGGVALGSIIGLTPMASLHNYIVLFIILVTKINKSAALLSAALFALIAFLTDPLADSIGYTLLVKIDALTPLWTRLYNMPFVPFTRFNNTVVLGSLVISLALFLPVFFLTNKFIIYYRANLRLKVENSKVLKLFKLNSVFNLYNKFKGE